MVHPVDAIIIVVPAVTTAGSGIVLVNPEGWRDLLSPVMTMILLQSSGHAPSSLGYPEWQ